MKNSLKSATRRALTLVAFGLVAISGIYCGTSGTPSQPPKPVPSQPSVPTPDKPPGPEPKKAGTPDFVIGRAPKAEADSLLRNNLYLPPWEYRWDRGENKVGRQGLDLQLNNIMQDGLVYKREQRNFSLQIDQRVGENWKAVETLWPSETNPGRFFFAPGEYRIRAIHQGTLYFLEGKDRQAWLFASPAKIITIQPNSFLSVGLNFDFRMSPH